MKHNYCALFVTIFVALSVSFSVAHFGALFAALNFCKFYLIFVVFLHEVLYRVLYIKIHRFYVKKRTTNLLRVYKKSAANTQKKGRIATDGPLYTDLVKLN